MFYGANPNGEWQLFVRDESGGDMGTIAGGWSLTVTALVRADRTVTLDTNKSKVKKGRKVVLSGQLNAPDNETACESGQTVELERKKPGQTDFATVEQLQTDATGNFSTKEKVKKTFEYCAQVGETATCNDQVSDTEGQGQEEAAIRRLCLARVMPPGDAAQLSAGSSEGRIGPPIGSHGDAGNPHSGKGRDSGKGRAQVAIGYRAVDGPTSVHRNGNEAACGMDLH